MSARRDPRPRRCAQDNPTTRRGAERLRPKQLRQRQLGQNFLTERRLLERIVALSDLDPDDLVLEFGAGKGHLTAVLARRCRRSSPMRSTARSTNTRARNCGICPTCS